MKLVIRNTTILLVLGLAINILIAWSCALFASMEVSGHPQALTTQVRNKWIDRSPWPHKLRPGRTLRSGSFGLEYDLLQSGYDNPNFWHTALAMRAGLPLSSLYGERWSNFASEDAGKDHEDQFAFVYSFKPPLAEDEGDPNLARLLPWRPILPGFITNTIFYALLLRGVGMLWKSVRQARNLHLDRCPNCQVILVHEKTASCFSCGWTKGITNAHHIE